MALSHSCSRSSRSSLAHPGDPWSFLPWLISSLDFSINYDVNENLTVSFDGTNLTDDVANDYFGGDSSQDARLYPRDTYIRDRTFALGIRYRM